MLVSKITKMVMKSLFRKPATLMYPVVPRVWKERTRGHISIVEKDCILCGICSRKCPTLCIRVDKGERVWEIQRMQCIQCGCCVEVCPKKCLGMEKTYTTPETYKVTDTFRIPEPPPKPAAPKPAAPKPADAPAAAKGPEAPAAPAAPQAESKAPAEGPADVKPADAAAGEETKEPAENENN